jgi:hypothetical protein
MRFLILVTAMLAVSGCASSSSKKIDQDLDARLQSAPTASTYEEFGKNARKQIKDSGATSEQKAKLLQLQRDTQDRSIQLRDQYYKLRSLLIQDLAGKNYDRDEVEAIKGRLKKIEDQRLQLIFTAVDQASTILGHDQVDQNVQIMRTFDFEGHSNEE